MILASSLEGAAIRKPGLKEWKVFLNRLGVYIKHVVTPVISLFAIQTTAWESEFALRSLQASMSCQSF